MVGTLFQRSRRSAPIAAFTALLCGCALAGTAATPARAQTAHRPSASTARRIVGGNPTTIGQWPWQVALAVRPSVEKGGGLRRQFCGGSLVAPRYVITAGHCVFSEEAPPGHRIEVISGRTQLSTDVGTVTKVRRVWAPIGKPPYLLYGGDPPHWDVAVLELAGPAEGTPIKIAGPGEGSAWSAGATAYATGWGLKSRNGKKSDRLRSVALDVKAPSACGGAAVYGHDFDPALMLCAGAAGRDTCQGDSGGPLVVPFYGGFRLVGDTSFGKGCAKPGYSGVYARLSGPPIRDVLQHDLYGLGGFNVAGGAPVAPPARPGHAAARAAASSYSRKLCGYYGRSCHRHTVPACHPRRYAVRCRVKLYMKDRQGRSRIIRDVLVGDSGDGARVDMSDLLVRRQGWR